ncbi:TonB-dependent receptor [Pelistega sp. NLN82]|uniref:TonB-dependent receptor n=1 Tax=Pelistega ratti TaxID=2652177 RepID=A0A6L9Y454_9BURK|nr:TonB-dependent receptor [Pelistega ratti]NEN74955.1 TonB-dependent receptor [Pelistega ratti]
MNLKLSICTFLSSFITITTFAQELANPDTIEPIKFFSPPKPITPNIALGYFPENQFDRTDRRDYYFVTENIDKAFRPLKINSGFYGKNFYNAISAQARGANFYGIANLNHTKANGYKDGAGHDVDWGYKRFNQSVILGFVPSEYQEYKLTYLHDNIDDDKQPEFVMDPIKTERHIAKLNARWGKADLSNTLQAETSFIKMQRHADNYTLRENRAQNIYLDLERKMFNFSLKHDYDIGQFHNTAAISYQHDYFNGERYLHTPRRDILNGYRFGDVHINRYRLSNTLSYRFNEQHKLGLGLTYEFNEAEVRKNTTRLANPMNPRLAFANPQQIWQAHYGYTFDGKVRQETFSGELQYDYTPSEYQKYSLTLAHIERVGNHLERFNSIAAIIHNTINGQLMNQRPVAAIVGNPLLKPEQHNFIKLSIDTKNDAYNDYMNSLTGQGWHIGGDLIFDKVKDLIIFDRARNQRGVSTQGGGIIARNVDARLFTAQAYAHYNFNAHWAAGLKARYNYGQNETDGRALYQMRPFELMAQADYKDYFSLGSYNVGITARYVAKQHRGDFDKTKGLGIDNHEAAKSFVVADIYAGINIHDKYGVRLGINNIFDKRYAEFISGDHVVALSPTAVVNAPGRTYWLSLHAAF